VKQSMITVNSVIN